MREGAAANVRRVRILGIDPGSRATGFGLIEDTGGQLVHVESGVIRTVGGNFTERLRDLHTRSCELFSRLAPDECAIEKVFVSKNADSALKLGAARASVLCAGFATTSDFGEYAPRAVKQALVGNGAADKQQVQHMVRIILGLPSKQLALDASDALAIAITHSHSRRAGLAQVAASQ